MLKSILLSGSLLMGNWALHAQTARVQVIHNCADAAAATVDVYVGTDLFLNDVDFRTASPFDDAPAGIPLVVAIAPGTSASVADAVFSTTVTLEEGGTYVIVANGIVSSTGYSPSTPFELTVYDMARESASMPGNVDVLVAHGCTDAGTVDVTPVGAGSPLVNDISFGEFAGYLELPEADYAINVTSSDGSTIAASYLAPLETLNLGGEALVVVASGFLDPSVNSDGPAFGLWAALPSGGELVELPANTNARVQVIHNCADAAAASVDVYLNDEPLLDNFMFRTATSYINAPANVPLTLAIQPSSSTSSDDPLFEKTLTLEAGHSYVVTASGIVSAEGYSPEQPFDLLVYDMGRETASVTGNTDVLVMHGCTDAPTVDVKAGATTLIDDISYGEYAGYLSLPAADYTITVTLDDGTTAVQSFSAPLETLELQNKSIVVLASGFLDPSANSSSSNVFGLWAALPEGGPLQQLPDATTGIYNVTNRQVMFKLYPNPASQFVNIEGTGGNVKEVIVYDLAGREVLRSNTINESRLDVRSLVNGTYFVHVFTDDGKLGFGKLIKM